MLAVSREPDVDLVVDVADLKVMADPSVRLVTYGLGTCIAVTLWDRWKGVGGLLHFKLPESRLMKARAQETPSLFGDTGIRLLFQQAFALGASKDRLLVKLIGGSDQGMADNVFAVGRKNAELARTLLGEMGIRVEAEDTGGALARNVILDLSNGQVSVSSAGRRRIL